MKIDASSSLALSLARPTAPTGADAFQVRTGDAAQSTSEAPATGNEIDRGDTVRQQMLQRGISRLVRDEVSGRVRANAEGLVQGEAGGRVRANVEGLIQGEAGDGIRTNIEDAARTELSTRIRENVQDRVRELIESRVSEHIHERV